MGGLESVLVLLFTYIRLKKVVSSNPNLKVITQKIPTLKFYFSYPSPYQLQTQETHFLKENNSKSKTCFYLSTYLSYFFWTVTGNKYFFRPKCDSLKNKDWLLDGTLA